jgi:predicted phosphoribosyltransferase
MRRFADRASAGRELAEALAPYADRDDVVVLGLPRGGVPVAAEVAGALRAPLDVFVVRKLGVPGHEELAFGAIASGGVVVINDEVVDAAGLELAAIDDVIACETAELERRERIYRTEAEPLAVAGRVAIVVDDGLATGATMRAAAEALRDCGAARIVAAVPVGTTATAAELRRVADEVVCLRTPDPFLAVGRWYRDFSPTSDREVTGLLETLRRAAEN